MNTVWPLIAADDVSRFGGKAVSLAKMLQNDLPVPDGFAVDINAFTQNGSLRSEAKHQIEELTKSSSLYAVRSSALAEDSLGASWAGQFETFLNTPPEDVISKIEACHASKKLRAKAYASDKLEPDKFQIAVVVQEMVEPSYAGLAFTKDPSTGTNQIIFEYVQGLG